MCEEETNSTWSLEEPSQELLQWAEKNINEISDTKYQVLSDFKDLIFSKYVCITFNHIRFLELTYL